MQPYFDSSDCRYSSFTGRKTRESRASGAGHEIHGRVAWLSRAGQLTRISIGKDDRCSVDVVQAADVG